MSSRAGAFVGLPLADPPGQRRGRVALGIALSLVAHLMLLSAWRGKLFHERGDERVAPPRSIAVWLRPPAPKPIPQREHATTPSKASPAARPHKPRRVIAVPRREEEAAGRQVVRQDDEPLAPQPSGPVEGPKFDHDAAVRMARQIAAEPDPSGTPRKPLQTETRLARAISAAKRRDCKDGLPGGLLGPLIIMLDKKDSGCKW